MFHVSLILNITYTEENRRRIAEMAEDCRVELLKYNSFTGAKYKILGKSYSLQGTKEYTNDVTKFFNNAVLQ